MSQEQELVTQVVEEIRKEVEKINEILRETKIEELCKKLRAYANALDAVINEKHYAFKLHFSITSYSHAGREYAVRLYVDNEYIYTVHVEPGTTIDALFEKVFTSEDVRNDIVKRIHGTLVEVAKEIADKADIIERIRSIEERLEEEDP
jgi:hypothetical protein